MFIMQPYQSQENEKIIQQLQESLGIELPIFSSESEIEPHLKSVGDIPQIGVFFIREGEDAFLKIEKIHETFDQYGKMVFLIGVLETEAKKYESKLLDILESVLHQPLQGEDLLKEVKKGESLIRNLNEQIKSTALESEKVSTIEGIDVAEILFFFNHKKDHVLKDLEKIQKTTALEEQKAIFSQLKDNFVWKDKVIAKKVKKEAFSFDSQYFSLDEKTGELKALQLGIVEFSLSKLHFFPIFALEENNMKAYGFVFPLLGMDDREGLNFYIECMKSQGISKGLLFDAINRAYVRCYENNCAEYVLLAEGRLPEDGHEGYVELKKKQKESVGKVIDKLGTIDYRERDTIINLTVGELIAKKVPEKPEVHGYDVSGKVLEAKKEACPTWELGENIEFKEETLTYHAMVEGMLVFEGNTIHLKETIVIEGDVDLKTGNVYSNKNIIIKGNVDPEMYVEAKGNIVINGIVEDAKVVAGGNIEVHGLSGSGKTWVFCKGSIQMNFSQNSQIEALGDIRFHKFIVNGEIMTTEKLIGEDKSRVFGCKIQAAKGCDLFDLGNNQEITTKVSLGVNFYNEKVVSKILDRVNLAKKEQESIIKILKENLNLSQPLEPQLKQKPRNQAMHLLSKINELKEKRAMVLKLEDSFKKLTKGTKEEFAAKLRIRNTIFPGVDLAIVGTNKKILKKADRVEFFFSPSEADIVSVVF